MGKDKLPKEEEISAQELEQVSGGIINADIYTVKLQKEISSIAVDSLQKVKSLEPDPWERTR